MPVHTWTCCCTQCVCIRDQYLLAGPYAWTEPSGTGKEGVWLKADRFSGLLLQERKVSPPDLPNPAIHYQEFGYLLGVVQAGGHFKPLTPRNIEDGTLPSYPAPARVSTHQLLCGVPSSLPSSKDDITSPELASFSMLHLLPRQQFWKQSLQSIFCHGGCLQA